jgi:hypothetical protein
LTIIRDLGYALPATQVRLDGGDTTMPGHRTFDYELLKRLVRDHPDWSHHEYARELTRLTRESARNSSLPMIKPNTVSVALSRWRDTWAEEGIVVAPTLNQRRSLPWVGIPEAYRMDTPLRYLRVLVSIDAGEEVDPRMRRLALQWARKRQETRTVTDLLPGGRPVIRAARRDELDGEGNLLSLHARYPGLTEQQWQSMTPDERRQASKKWMAAEKTSA